MWRTVTHAHKHAFSYTCTHIWTNTQEHHNSCRDLNTIADLCTHLLVLYISCVLINQELKINVGVQVTSPKCEPSPLSLSDNLCKNILIITLSGVSLQVTLSAYKDTRPSFGLPIGRNSTDSHLPPQISSSNAFIRITIN